MRNNEIKEGLELWLWLQNWKKQIHIKYNTENPFTLDSLTNKKWKRREKLKYV